MSGMLDVMRPVCDPSGADLFVHPSGSHIAAFAGPSALAVVWRVSSPSAPTILCDASTALSGTPHMVLVARSNQTLCGWRWCGAPLVVLRLREAVLALSPCVGSEVLVMHQTHLRLFHPRTHRFMVWEGNGALATTCLALPIPPGTRCVLLCVGEDTAVFGAGRRLVLLRRPKLSHTEVSHGDIIHCAALMEIGGVTHVAVGLRSGRVAFFHHHGPLDAPLLPTPPEEGMEHNSKEELPHAGAVTCAARSAHFLFTGGVDGRVVVWAWETRSPLHRMEGQTGVRDMQLHPHYGHVATFNEDGSVRMCDWRNGRWGLVRHGHHGRPIVKGGFLPAPGAGHDMCSVSALGESLCVWSIDGSLTLPWPQEMTSMALDSASSYTIPHSQNGTERGEDVVIAAPTSWSPPEKSDTAEEDEVKGLSDKRRLPSRPVAHVDPMVQERLMDVARGFQTPSRDIPTPKASVPREAAVAHLLDSFPISSHSSKADIVVSAFTTLPNTPRQFPSPPGQESRVEMSRQGPLLPPLPLILLHTRAQHRYCRQSYGIDHPTPLPDDASLLSLALRGVVRGQGIRPLDWDAFLRHAPLLPLIAADAEAEGCGEAEELRKHARQVAATHPFPALHLMSMYTSLLLDVEAVMTGLARPTRSSLTLRQVEVLRFVLEVHQEVIYGLSSPTHSPPRILFRWHREYLPASLIGRIVSFPAPAFATADLSGLFVHLSSAKGRAPFPPPRMAETGEAETEQRVPFTPSPIAVKDRLQLHGTLVVVESRSAVACGEHLFLGSKGEYVFHPFAKFRVGTGDVAHALIQERMGQTVSAYQTTLALWMLHEVTD